MARMIPAEIPADTASPAEIMLFPVLRDGLNDSFTIFHSFNLLTRNRENKFIDGEIDFLIFSPERGFLVLEVKSGVIRFEGESGRWFQNGYQLEKSPFEQAKYAMYQLEAFLNKQIGIPPSITFAYAVCFPDVFEEIKHLPSGADSEFCINANRLNAIGKSIDRIFNLFTKIEPAPLNKPLQERIRQSIMPYCEYGASLIDRIGQGERKIFALTENQCRLLDFLGERREVLIEGCAGSGKTIMAVKKARELAGKGKTVLLLAYNEMIGARLAEAVRDLPCIKAAAYHDYCQALLERAGKLPPQTNDETAWYKRDIPEAFFSLIGDNPIKFDAVIIDEGQDFTIDYWITIEELRKPGGYFYIFYDPAQNLFVKECDFPIKGQPYKLNQNCRNSRNVYDVVKDYARHEMTLLDGAPEGEQVVELSGDSVRARRRHLTKILQELVHEKGLKTNQIVILGGHSLDNTCLGSDHKIGEFTITDIDDEGPRLIHYHTYMKFKGCEADAVILLDVDEKDPRWNDAKAMYTAASRAKYMLYIIKCLQ